MKLGYLIVGAAVLLSSNASASTITKTYNITLEFPNGSPDSSVNQTFTATFDPNSAGPMISGYATSSTLPSFNLPLGLEITKFGTFLGFTLYGTPFGTSVTGFTDDFYTQFLTDLDGNPNGSATSAYSSGGAFFDSTSGRVSIVEAAVPEPATWALMIAGFGLVGGAMRRRRIAKVSYA